MTRALLLPLLLVASCASSPAGLREGELAWSEQGGFRTFPAPDPDPATRLLPTVVVTAREGGGLPDRRHGLVTGTHARLLEPEWLHVDLTLDPVVYSTPASGGPLWRHLLGPGPSIARSEQTPYFATQALPVSKERAPAPPGARGFALPLALSRPRATR